MSWFAWLLIGLLIGFVIEYIMDLFFFRGRRLCTESSERVASLIEKNSNLEREKAQLDARLGVIDTDLTRLRRIGISSEGAGDAASIATIRTQMEARIEENSQLREKLAAEAANAVALRTQLDARMEEISRLREKSVADTAILRSQLDARRDEISKLTVELATVSEKLEACRVAKASSSQSNISSVLAALTGAVGSSRGNVTVHVSGSEWQRPLPESAPPETHVTPIEPTPVPERKSFEGTLRVERPYELTAVLGIGEATAEKLEEKGITTLAELCTAVTNKDEKVWQALTEGDPPNWVNRRPWKTADDFYKDDDVIVLWKEHICAMQSGDLSKNQKKLDDKWGNPDENFESICGITKGIEDDLYDTGIRTWYALSVASNDDLRPILTQTNGRKEKFRNLYGADEENVWADHIRAQAGILAGDKKGRYRRLAIYQLEHCGPSLEKICGISKEMCEGLSVAILKKADAAFLQSRWSGFQNTLFKDYGQLLEGQSSDHDKWSEIARLIRDQARWIEEGKWVELYEFRRDHDGQKAARTYGALEEGWHWKEYQNLTYAENEEIFNKLNDEYWKSIASLSYAERKTWLESNRFEGPDSVTAGTPGMEATL
jgi:predicted flap endonuclease-1-like 5' DNA nuclease